MKFPTIKTKKDSLYITLFFYFPSPALPGYGMSSGLRCKKGIAEKRSYDFHVIAKQ